MNNAELETYLLNKENHQQNPSPTYSLPLSIPTHIESYCNICERSLQIISTSIDLDSTIFVYTQPCTHCYELTPEGYQKQLDNEKREKDRVVFEDEVWNEQFK